MKDKATNTHKPTHILTMHFEAFILVFLVATM